MISDITSYSVSDFILFSRDVLLTLMATYNAEIWPFQVVAAVAGVLLLVLTRRSGRLAGRGVAALVGGAWLFTGLVFHGRYYVTINWAAIYFSWMFIGTGLLWLGLGTVGGMLSCGGRGRVASVAGTVLLLGSTLLYAPAALLAGRGWESLLLFGWGPSQTAVGSLGVLLLVRGHWAAAVLAVPAVLWTGIALLTEYGLRA